jgi:hypothetical protein
VKIWKKCQGWKVFQTSFTTFMNFLRFLLTLYLFFLCGKVIFEVFWNWKNRWRLGTTCQRLCRHAPCPGWPAGAALPSRPCLKGAIPTTPHACPSAPPRHFDRASAPLPVRSPRRRFPHVAAPPWATALLPTKPEHAVYREPLSPSAPFAGTAAASPPHALFTVDHTALSLEPRTVPPWSAAAATTVQAPGQECACTWATTWSHRHTVVRLSCPSVVRQV